MSGTTDPLKGLIKLGRFSHFEDSSGVRIRYASWEPKEKARGTVVFLNGRAEFIEKYIETISELLAKGYAVWSKDWRGQGLSSRPLLNPRKGHADSFEPLLSDLHIFLTKIVCPNSEGPYIALAHSMGGHLVLRYLAEHPGIFAQAVVLSPMIDIHTRAWPRAVVEKLAKLVVCFGLGDRYVPGMGDADPYQVAFSKNLLTSDSARFRQTQAWTIEEPSLGLGGPTYGWMRATYESIRKLENPNYVSTINVPVLFISAENDRIVLNDAQERLVRNMPRAHLISLAEARHEIMLERDPIRVRFWEAFDQFIDLL